MPGHLYPLRALSRRKSTRLRPGFHLQPSRRNPGRIPPARYACVKRPGSTGKGREGFGPWVRLRGPFKGVQARIWRLADGGPSTEGAKGGADRVAPTALTALTRLVPLRLLAASTKNNRKNIALLSDACKAGRYKHGVRRAGLR